MSKYAAFLTTLLACAVFAPDVLGQTFCVTAPGSQFQIEAGAGGLFGVFAHDHLIAAKEIDGCAEVNFDNLSRSSVRLVFRTSGVKVVDPKASPNDRAKIQQQMEAEVLRVMEFPEVQFVSTAVQPTQGMAGALRVSGNLTIRGTTRSVNIPLLMEHNGSKLRVRGQYAFKQTDYGIKPVRIAAGTIKVKDEVKVDFDLQLSQK